MKVLSPPRKDRPGLHGAWPGAVQDVGRPCPPLAAQDQDFWWLSGLFRSVRLYAKPHVYIADYTVKTTFTDAHMTDARVSIVCKLGTATLCNIKDTRFADQDHVYICSLAGGHYWDVEGDHIQARSGGTGPRFTGGRGGGGGTDDVWKGKTGHHRSVPHHATLF